MPQHASGDKKTYNVHVVFFCSDPHLLLGGGDELLLPGPAHGALGPRQGCQEALNPRRKPLRLKNKEIVLFVLNGK